jgi:rhodanese-related sulfurtransferase
MSSSRNLPGSDAAVPRIPVEEAGAALADGTAIIVDVRSARATFFILPNGHTRVTTILSGFEAWIDAGYPVE